MRNVLFLLAVLMLSGCSSIVTRENPDKIFYGEIIELINPSDFQDTTKLNSLSAHLKGSPIARVLIGGGAGGVNRQTVVYAYAYTNGKVGDMMKIKGLTDIALEGINDRYLLAEQIKLIEPNEFTCYTKKLPNRPNSSIGVLTLLTTGTASFALSVNDQFKDKDEHTKCEGWFSYYDEHVGKYHYYKHERHANKFIRSEEQISTTNSEKLKLKSLIDNHNGTITDNMNKLQWMRCSLGQKWDGKTCIGQADKTSFDNASKQAVDYSGKNDWRLPTLDELLSIRYCSDGFMPGTTLSL